MAQINDKTTVLFTNEAMNDAINFKEIIPALHLAYRRENLNEYYKLVRVYLTHNQHIISKKSNTEMLLKVWKTLDEVGGILFNKQPLVKQKQASYAKERSDAFLKLEKIVLYVNQELQKIGYFKKSITTSGDFMDEYIKGQ